MVAAAWAFVARNAGKRVGANRQFACFANNFAFGIGQLHIGKHNEFHRASRRLARREVPSDACARVVFEGDAMANEIVEFAVIRHRKFRIP